MLSLFCRTWNSQQKSPFPGLCIVFSKHNDCSAWPGIYLHPKEMMGILPPKVQIQCFFLSPTPPRLPLNVPQVVFFPHLLLLLFVPSMYYNRSNVKIFLSNGLMHPSSHCPAVCSPCGAEGRAEAGGRLCHLCVHL